MKKSVGAPQRSKRLNVFGFLSRECTAQTWTSDRAITAEFVVDAIEEWVAEKLVKPRVLVLDNARIHRSRLMQGKLAEWEAREFVCVLFARLFAAFEFD